MGKISTLVVGAIAAAGILGGITTAVPAHAASATQPTIAVSPTRVEIHVTPSKTTHQRVMLLNDSTIPFTVTSMTSLFGQTSTGAIEGVASKEAGVSSGTSWITVSPSSFTLAPESTKAVTISITVPHAVQPGQRYLGVIFTEHTPNNLQPGATVGAGIIGGVGFQMILDTPGKTVSDTSYGLHAPALSWGGPITVTGTVQNKGNVYTLLSNEGPSIGGSKVMFPGALVLGGNSRTLTTTWQRPPMIGYETVTWQGHSAHVLILPGKILVIVFGVLILVFAYVFFLRSHSKKRKHGSRAKTSKRPVGAHR